MSRVYTVGTIIVAAAIGFAIYVNVPNHTHSRAVAIPASCTYRAGGLLPDSHCTPGAVNRHVTQSDIHQTICVRGWTSTIRPPLSYTEPLKHKLLAAYGQPDTPANYELDHLIPLELGGDPQSVKNLWPEPHPGAYAKDGVENKLRSEVCQGMMLLAHARYIMRHDWRQG